MYKGMMVAKSPTKNPWGEWRLCVAKIYAPNPEEREMTMDPIESINFVSKSTYIYKNTWFI
jgi:hypothetical protein